MPKTAKRGAQGSGNIRKRPDGTWEARYTVGRDPGTGKQVQRSVYGQTQAEVRKKLAAAVSALDTNTYQERTRITVAQWLDEWYANYCENLLKRYSLMSYETIIRKHLKPAFGAKQLFDLTTGDVQRLVQQMTKAGYSPKTIKNAHGCLSSAIEQARADGKIAKNVCEFVKLPKLDIKEVAALSVEQMTALLDAASGDEYEKVFFVCLFCGLRKGEALGLSWRQIDFTHNRITIDQQLQRTTVKLGGYYIMDETKNGKPRVLDVPNFIMDTLRSVQHTQREERIKAGAAWSNEWELVFTDALGCHMEMVTMHKHFKRAAAAAGVPDARIHDLRHSFATLSLYNGDDIKTVQNNLGHATAAFTLQRYAHATEKMRRDSADRMQSFYEQSIEKKA